MLLALLILAACSNTAQSAASIVGPSRHERNLSYGQHRAKRTASNVALDYGVGGHPFDSYSSVTNRELQWQTGSYDGGSISANIDVYFEGNRYPTTKSPTTTTPKPSAERTTPSPTIIKYDPLLYEPLRIHIDTRRLDSLVNSNPSRYAQLIDHLTNRAAPQAAEFWKRHLSTIPVEGEITITANECPLAFQGGDISAHTFNNTDLVLYLFLDEGPCDGENPPIAFSNDCAMDQFDRPIAGFLLLCSANFESISIDSEEGASQRQKMDEVLQHELAHVLGMSASSMPFWRDALKGGSPRTPRPLREQEALCVNGTMINITIPSEDTVKMGTTQAGVRYFEVVTPTVRNVVANQFNCESATGARLDNFDTYDCIGSHWSPRIFGTETMVARNMPYEQQITAVTLALFEDTGWYKANYAASPGVISPSAYLYGMGCNVLTKNCITDDNVPEFGIGTFCDELTTESPVRCDVSHSRFTRCDLVDYTTYSVDPVYPFLSNSMPTPTEEYQYFTNTVSESLSRYVVSHLSILHLTTQRFHKTECTGIGFFLAIRC